MTDPAVGYLIRIELRRQAKSLFVLGFLVALVVGTVVASLAGANRSASAFDRYLEGYNSPDAAAFDVGDPAARQARVQMDQLDAVEDTVEFELVSAFPSEITDEFFPFVVSEDGELPFDRMHAPVVDGRYPDRDAPLEFAPSERTAARLGLSVGDTLLLSSFTQESSDDADGGPAPEPDGPSIDLEVVGIVRDPGDIGARESDITLSFLTPSFRDAYPPEEVGTLSEGSMVVLAEGHTLSEVAAAVAEDGVEIDSSLSTESAFQQATPTMRSIATALRLFALVAGLAGLIAIGQAATRLQDAAGGDDPTLGALGATRTDRWARLAAPSILAVAGGTVVGLGLGVAASPLFPIGLARRADPDLGFHVDYGTLVLGGVVTVTLLGALVSGVALWRVRRTTKASTIMRVSRWGRIAAEAGTPAPAVTGLSLASGTPGRPGRIAVGGTMLSVMGVLAAFVFSTSLDHLRDEPDLYGWGFDAVMESEVTDNGDPTLPPGLDTDPDVLDLSTLYTQIPITLDGTPAFATAVTEPAESLDPVMVRGDAPRGADELAVGGDTLESMGAHVGDTIDVSLGEAPHRMRITGVVALPVPADGGSAATGAYLSPASVTPLDVPGSCEHSDSCTAAVALGLRDGADLQAFSERYRGSDSDLWVDLPAPPAEIDRLTAVEDLPRYMAVFLAALAAAAISFATATTVRQRRRDLAVLRVLGMTGRDVRSVVAVLVLALTGFGALLGGALGIIVGRQVWRAVMGSVSLPFSPSLPVAAIVLVPLASVLLAQAVASTSRRSAGRTPAAVVLRTE